MQLTQKIRIQPTTAQELVLNDLSEKCRLIYNFALNERKICYANNTKISWVDQLNNLPSIKIKYPEYKWVYSKVLQNILRTLDADYKSFYALNKKGDKKARLPNFKGKQFFTTMNYNQSGFKCRKGIIELSHKHPLGTKLYFKIPEKYLFQKVIQITVFKDKKEFYLSIVYEKNELEFIDNNLVQAFDLGLIKQTAVNIQGKFIELINKRPDKYWQKPKEQLQSRMSHCRKYSRRWFKLNKQFTHCTTKSANQLKDFQHKLSRKIIKNTKANTIIVGDLSVKEMSMNSKIKGLSRSLQNTGSIGRLVGFLAYKAKLAGKRVIKINESNTSKTCYSCGKKKEMPLSERVYMCSCGNTIDRDRNSSINIMSKYLCTNGLWTAYQNFSDNLRQTGLVITNHSQEATSSITEGD